MIQKKSSTVLASAQFVYDWHKREHAFERLLPPWESVQIVDSKGSFETLSVQLKMKRFGVPIQWIAQHEDVIDGKQFVDRQIKGPFKSWVHRHLFESLGDDRIKMTDHIDFQLPLQPFSQLLEAPTVGRDIQAMLSYRHQQVMHDLQLLYSLPLEPQVIAISGATGLVGRQLSTFLTAAGHKVRRLVRKKVSNESDLRWDPLKGILDDFSDVTVLIHLAGESIAAPIRWSKKKKEKIHDSRIYSTKILVDQLQTQSHAIHTMICASAIGFYPDSSTPMTETSKPGNDFLSNVVVGWEAACDPLRHTIRICNARLGTVLHPNGGMLQRLDPLMTLGLLGPIGAGDQFFSWVALDDAVRAIYTMIATPDLSGPINVVSPTPQTQLDWVKDWARSKFRPALAPLPAPIVRLVMGEMGEQLLLRSSRVVPTQLQQQSFNFQCLTMQDVCRLYYK